MLSKIKKDLSKMQENQKNLKKLGKAINKDLRERGYFETHKKAGIFTIVSFLSLFIVGWSYEFISSFIGNFAIIIIIFIVSVLIGSIMMLDRRTRKGYEALDYLKGFKEYLSVTEKDRYEFHNAPSLNSQQFMEFLPYAIAFGVEDEWAEVFKDIQIESPSWYGSADGTSFDAPTFARGLGAFSSSFASSTGSSGSSGGGSAGGGSGGGGGGSW